MDGTGDHCTQWKEPAQTHLCFSSIQNLDCVCECKVHTYLHIYVIWCKSRMGIYEKGESSLIGSGWETKGSQWCSYLMKAVGKLIWAWISKMEREGWGRVIGGQIKAKSNNTCMWYIYIWHIWHIHVYDDITVALMFLHGDQNIRTGISGCFSKTFKSYFCWKFSFEFSSLEF